MRHLPGRSFPPYAFLPGRDPHPTRDPLGHSFESEEETAAPLPPERWRESGPYLWGVDLYNHGYLWEAHEAWEGLWHASKGDELQALFLQGLIQCAAACLKIPMDQPRGLARLSELGVQKLERVARAGHIDYMGLDLMDYVERVRAFAGSSPESIEGRPLISLG